MVTVSQALAVAAVFVVGTTASARAQSEPERPRGEVRASSEEPRATDESEETRWNVVSIRVGHMFAVNRARLASETGAAPERESLLGFTLSYERVLVPELLAIEIALPFFFNLERFDTPLELNVVLMQRFGIVEPCIHVGVTTDVKIFPGARGNAEGSEVEFSAGLGAGIGVNIEVAPRWLLQLELTYAWIPEHLVAEHEFAQLAGMGHAF